MLPRKCFYILGEVYANPGVNVTTIMKKAKVSQASFAALIKALLERKLVVDKYIGKSRLFYPNLDSADSIYIYSMIETEKRKSLMERSELKASLGYLITKTEKLDEIEVCLVYGSYARGLKGNDLDLLFIVNRNIKKKLAGVIEETFATTDLKVSAKVIKKEEFLKKINEPIYKGIVKEHILLVGAENWLRMVRNVRE